MAQMIINGVFPVTDDNEALFFDLWDEDNADPVKIEHLVTVLNTKMQRLDNPKAPYCPDPVNNPNIELWLWADPNNPANPDKMIALKVNVKKNSQGSFEEEPQKWILGKSALGIVVYKKSCCPEHSAMLCGEFEDGFDFVIRDSARTHSHEKQFFAKMVEHDSTGQILAHEYGHVKNGDRKCDHKHRPK